ncbi:MAG: hypothetical protein L7F77_00390 [Candidatus Magnetominusculus sp. LBB02]|nr:hypothetical protein [Candidatus Magnetominusculus sp. LBB02]
MSGSQFKETPACVVKAAAVPNVVECPSCGAELEMWSDEDEARCKTCDAVVTRSR